MRPIARQLLLLLSFGPIVVGLPAVAVAQTVDAATREEILRTREAVWRAWFEGDEEALNRLVPPALAAGSPEGWQERARTMADARGWAQGGGRLIDLRFEGTSFAGHGGVVVLFARFSYTVIDPGAREPHTVQGRASEVFVRRDGLWVNPFWYLEPEGRVGQGQEEPRMTTAWARGARGGAIVGMSQLVSIPAA